MEMSETEGEKRRSLMHWLRTTPSSASTAAAEQRHEENEFRGAAASTATALHFNTKIARVTAAAPGHRIPANPRQITTQIARISYRSDGTQDKQTDWKKIAPSSLQRPQRIEAGRLPSETPALEAAKTRPVVQNRKSPQQMEFEKKRDERDKEIEEIQEMLKEMRTSPEPEKSSAAPTMPITEPKETLQSTETKPESQRPKKAENVKMKTFQRSRTDGQIERSRTSAAVHAPQTTRMSRRDGVRSDIDKQRSKSSHLPLTKLTDMQQAETNVPSVGRKTGYNPAEARRYMQEQRRKRRAEMQQNKGALEKEEIRKRLEELRKNTKQLMAKNLKKSRQKRVVSPQKGSAPSETPQESIPTQPADRPENPSNLEDISLHLKVSNTARQKEVEPATKTQTCSNGIPPLGENRKRIGFLRKTEIGKDHSFSAIRDFSFDKENVAVDMMTPNLTVPLELRKQQEKTERVSENQEELNKDEAGQPEVAQHLSHKSNDVERKKEDMTTNKEEEKETLLETPSKHLKPSNDAKQEKQSSPGQDLSKPNAAKTCDLPYWLQPSAVQIYPYNFIMAVRRKLEAITQPPKAPNPTTSVDNLRHQTTSTSDLRAGMPLPSHSSKQNQVRRRLVVGQEDHKATEKPIDPTGSNDNLPQLTYTQSDLNSNISSISLQLPIASNTVSQMSSLKSETHRTYTKQKSDGRVIAPRSEDDEATTVSSTVFGSPEKRQTKQQMADRMDFEFIKPRPVSPLSLERIEKWQIRTKQVEHNANSRSLRKLEKKGSGSSDLKEKKEVELDFTQLLDEFNRSLSQVIQVNEQLKTTLDKSQQLFSPGRQAKEPRSNDDYVYSTDFEESSDKTNSDLKVVKQNAAEMQRKRNLFEMVNVVKPLISPPKSSTTSERLTEEIKEEEEVMDKFDETLLPELDLKVNLGSLSNSSALTNNSPRRKENHIPSQSETTTDTPLSEEFEQRLEIIEKLKVDLKQNILQAQVNRKIDDIGLVKGQTKEKSYEKGFESIESRPFEEFYTKRTVSRNSTQSSQRNKKEVEETLLKQAELAHLDAPLKASLQRKDSRNESTQKAGNYPSHSHSTNHSSHKGSEVISLISKHSSSTTHSKKATSNHQMTPSKDRVIGKSIREELQKTFEAPSYDNDSNKLKCETTNKTEMESNRIKHRKPTRYVESETFIKTHINRSRGDFQANKSSGALENEREFRAALVAAARATGANTTDAAQSADDEITSSVTSVAGPPPSYDAVAAKQRNSQYHNSKVSRHSSISNELVTLFNSRHDSEASLRSTLNESISESSLIYSNVGLYDKLIQTETTKSQYLTALLKMREKALLDRTRGQIAWLELQKARYKAKGLVAHIAAIRKRQRGILLKMAKEREEIKRLLQSTTSSTSGHSSLQTETGSSSLTKHKRERVASSVPAILPTPLPPTKPPQRVPIQSSTLHKPQSAPVIRANYELEPSRPLEELLKKREVDLRRRREHVERLMQWHQRLDQEEVEVLQLERQLLNYNNVAQLSQPLGQQTETLTTTLSNSEASAQKRRTIRAHKMERRLKEIDKSLRELSSISATSTTVSMGHNNNEDNNNANSSGAELDFVRTTGHKLNKLWRRLTSQQVEKYEPNRRYKLCKADLERLYEEAKLAVLQDFAQDEERMAAELLENSASNHLARSPSEVGADVAVAVAVASAQSGKGGVTVPRLNLNFSFERSDVEEESTQNSMQTQQGNYSPSAAEVDFNAKAAGRGRTSSSSSDSESSRERSQRMERNAQMFLALTKRLSGRRFSGELQRSLSDTQISDIRTVHGLTSHTKNTASQRDIAATTSHESSATQSQLGATAPACAVNTNTVSLQNRQHPSDLENIPSIATNIREVTSRGSVRVRNEVASVSSSSVSSSSAVSSEAELVPATDAASSSEPEEKLSTQTNELVKDETFSEPNTLSRTLTQADADSEFEKDSRTATTGGGTGGTFSVQTDSDCDRKAREISAKLEEISAAVSQLSHSNALPSYQSSIKLQKKALVVGNGGASEEEPPISSQVEDFNATTNTNTSSYSYNFENISTDKHSSPSGATSTAKTDSVSHSESNEAEGISSLTLTKSETAALGSDVTSSTSNDSDKYRTFVADTEAADLLARPTIESRSANRYEADFETSASDETRIEDISLPAFETTAETTQDEVAALEVRETKLPSSESKSADVPPNSAENIYFSIQNSKIDGALNEKELFPAPPLPPPPPPPPPPPAFVPTNGAGPATASTSGSGQLMPDIINELELRRCHQIILENDLKQYDHVATVPYMYVREIPNKPPPPYVPPAHGSPMTAIFPSEDRIKEITYRRTHELYCELLNTEYCNEKGERLPSVMEEKITNIYERIILDICREYLEEHGEVLRQGDPTNFHSQLAFFNPPNRLRCIQEAIYKEVRCCLAMDKTPPKRTQVYSVYGQRAKQDHIGRIIIQEMYDEDDRWCNFHREENEVLELIVEEMIVQNIRDLAKEVLLAEGGSIDESQEPDANTENDQASVIAESISSEVANCSQSITDANQQTLDTSTKESNNATNANVCSDDDMTAQTCT